MGAIIARLGFDLVPVVDKVDLPNQGRVFVKHLPEVIKEKGEFIIIMNGESDFGIAVTPSSPMAAGFKKADSAEALARLAVQAGLAKPFVPRGFHAVVHEPLKESLGNPYGGCLFGAYQELDDGCIVLVVTEAPLEAGTLVEAVEARNNVLVVRQASFEVTDPYANDNWVGFIEDLLAEDKRRYRGRLTPRPAPLKIHGIWVGPTLDFVNRRGQASTKVIVDGAEEGSIADLYFTRVDKPTDQPIVTGSKVSVWYTGGSNVAVSLYDGKVDRAIDPEAIAEEMGIKLPGRTLESNGRLRVTRS